ncbi:Csu type fimbrial protein [Brevundimonas sp.]|uniref:Csu type fimbrial protein n=1 Tax=Brevundimonas sp. TaxID=1871086 RepID=UPI002FC58B8D
MRALIMIAALLAPPLLTPVPAAAQTTISPRCLIRTEPMSFRPYSALDQAPNTTTSQIEVVCDPLDRISLVRISLSQGRSGRHHDRTMTRGGSVLHYNIHTDPGHRRVAGDGTNGTVAPVRLQRGAGRATFRLYGIIPPRQRIRDGEYDDTLRVTIEF